MYTFLIILHVVVSILLIVVIFQMNRSKTRRYHKVEIMMQIEFPQVKYIRRDPPLHSAKHTTTILDEIISYIIYLLHQQMSRDGA